MVRVSDRAAERRGRRGFTFFELVLVVLIIGIIGAIVVPVVVNASTSPGLRSAANMLAADIEYCQSVCINTPQSLHQVGFDVAGNKYWVSPAGSSTPISHPGDGQTYLNDFATGRSKAFAGVVIQSISPATSALAFDAYGKPTGVSGNIVIVLSANGSTMTLTVDGVTGEVSIQ